MGHKIRATGGKSQFQHHGALRYDLGDYAIVMLLKLKLRKVGNSVGVILPKVALRHLNVEEGDSLSATEGPDGSLRLSPSRPDVTRQMEVMRRVMKRYRHTLRELAK